MTQPCFVCSNACPKLRGTRGRRRKLGSWSWAPRACRLAECVRHSRALQQPGTHACSPCVLTCLANARLSPQIMWPGDAAVGNMVLTDADHPLSVIRPADKIPASDDAAGPPATEPNGDAEDASGPKAEPGAGGLETKDSDAAGAHSHEPSDDPGVKPLAERLRVPEPGPAGFTVVDAAWHIVAAVVVETNRLAPSVRRARQLRVTMKVTCEEGRESVHYTVAPHDAAALAAWKHAHWILEAVVCDDVAAAALRVPVVVATASSDWAEPKVQFAGSEPPQLDPVTNALGAGPQITLTGVTAWTCVCRTSRR